MWETVGQVASGMTLVAFFAAVAAWVYRGRALKDLATIKLANPQDRPRIALAQLAFFEVDTRRLTKQAQVDLAIKQIDGRARRFLIAAVIVLGIAFLGAIVSIYALSRPSERAAETTDREYESIRNSIYPALRQAELQAYSITVAGADPNGCYLVTPAAGIEIASQPTANDLVEGPTAALAAMNQGEFTKALYALREPIVFEEDTVLRQITRCRLRAICLGRLSRDMECLEEYERVVELLPADPLSIGDVAACKIRLGRYRSALNDLRAAIQASQSPGDHISPTDKLFLLSSEAICLFLLGHLSNAVLSADAAIEHATNTGTVSHMLIEALSVRALCSTWSNDRDKALADYFRIEEVLASVPEPDRSAQFCAASATSLCNYAGFLASEGDFPESTRILVLAKHLAEIAVPPGESSRLTVSDVVSIRAAIVAIMNNGELTSDHGIRDALSSLSLRVAAQHDTNSRLHLGVALSLIATYLNPEGAVLMFNDAEVVFRSLSISSESPQPRYLLVRLLMNKSMHYSDVFEPEDALATANEALSLASELNFPENMSGGAMQSLLAFGHKARGRALLLLSKPRAAEGDFRRSVDLYSTAQGFGSISCLEGRVGALNGLAQAMRASRRLNEALAVHEAARVAAEDLISSRSTPNREMLLARVLHSMGVTQSESTDLSGAILVLTRSVSIYESLYRKGLLRLIRSGYGEVLSTLGSCLDDSGKHTEAAAMLLRAVNELERLRRQRPDGSPDHFLNALNNYCVALNRSGRIEEADEEYTKLSASLETLVFEENRPVYRGQLALSYANHAVCLGRSGRLEEACALASKSIRLRRELGNQGGTSALLDLVRGLLSRGRMRTEREAFTLASEDLTEALTLLKGLRDQGSERLGFYIGHACFAMAECEAGLSHWKLVLKWCTSAEEEFSPNDANVQVLTRRVWVKLLVSRSCFYLDDRAGAANALNDAKDIAEIASKLGVDLMQDIEKVESELESQLDRE